MILSDHELAAREHEAAALHLQALDRDRLDPRVLNGDSGTYNWFRKESYRRDGVKHGRVNSFKLAKALYPQIETPEEADSKRESIRRRLRRLQAAGVLEIIEHPGQDLEWRLVSRMPDPESWPDLKSYSARRYPDRAGPCSSIGAPTPRRRGCTLRDRDELPKGHPARRVHRWNRRIGHGSEHRYDVLDETGAVPLFSQNTFGEGRSSAGGLASLGLRPSDRVKGSAARRASSDALPGRSDRDGAAPPHPDRQVADCSTESGRPGAAPVDGPGHAPAASPRHLLPRLTGLGTRSEDFGWDGYDERHQLVSSRWARFEDRRRAALARLADRRYPGYADIAEAFGLVLGGPGAPDGWAEHRHARQATREALEREAARYDRYAGRLARDGVELPHPTAMDWLITGYLVLSGEIELASPGFVLTRLTRVAKRLRRAWTARHPDIVERRRAARRARYAELDGTLKLQFRGRRRPGWR